MHASQHTPRPTIQKYPSFVLSRALFTTSQHGHRIRSTLSSTQQLFIQLSRWKQMRLVCDCSPFSFSVIIISQIFTKVKISLSNFYLERICTFHGRPVITGASIGSSGPYLISVYLFRHKQVFQLLYLYYNKKKRKNQILLLLSQFQQNPGTICKAAPTIFLGKYIINPTIRNKAKNVCFETWCSAAP